MAAGAREVVRLILAGDASGFEGAVGKAEGAGGRMRAVGATIGAAGAAMAAAGLSVGQKWDTATKTIINGTGATGPALKTLQGDYQAVAGYGEGAASAVADLNTHLGLQGTELQAVAAQALKMGANTNFVGEAMAHVADDADGANKFLDVFHAGLQSSGVEADRMARQINKAIPQFADLGFSAEETVAHVVELANQYGHQGLIPALAASKKELKAGGQALGDYNALVDASTGSIDRSFAAGRTFRDVLGEMKNATIAYLGPAGDTVGVLGSIGAGLGGFMTIAPQIAGASKVMWAALTGPVGLAIAGITAVAAVAWYFRDEIRGAFVAVIDFVRPWVIDWLGTIEKVVGWIPGVGEQLGGMVRSARESFAEFGTAAEEGGGESGEAFVGGVEEAVDDPARGTAPTIAQSFMSSPAKATVATAAEDAAKAATEAFWDRAEKETEYRAKTSAFGFRTPETLAAIRQGATDAGLEWSTSFMHETDGLVETIQDTMTLTDEGWVLAGGGAGTVTGESFKEAFKGLAVAGGTEGAGAFSTAFEGFGGSISGTLARALEGGGGFLGAVGSLGTQAGERLGGALSEELGTRLSGLTEGMSGKLGGMLNGAIGMAMPLIGPALGAAATWIGKKLFGVFSKPSEAEKAARQSAADFVTTSKAELSPGGKFKVGELVSQGWSDSLATIRVTFGEYATAAGLTNDEAHAHYARYEAAVREGNEELMTDLIAQAQGWADGIRDGPLDQAKGDWDSLTVAEKVQLMDTLGDMTGEYTGFVDALAAGDLKRLESEWRGMTDDQWNALESMLEDAGGEYQDLVDDLCANDFEAIRNNWSDLTGDQLKDLNEKLGVMDDEYGAFETALKTGDFAAIKTEWAALTAAQQKDLTEKLGVMDTTVYANFVTDLESGEFSNLKTNWETMTEAQKTFLTTKLGEMDNETYGGFVTALKDGDFTAIATNWDVMTQTQKLDLVYQLGQMRTGPGGLSEFIAWVEDNPSEHVVGLDDSAVKDFSPPSNTSSTHTVHIREEGGGGSDYGGEFGEGFQHGTGGFYGMFGAGRRIVAHGMEAIVPRFTIPTLAGDIAAALASIVPVGATAGGPPVVIADVRIGDSELDRIADESMRRQERVLDFRGRA